MQALEKLQFTPWILKLLDSLVWVKHYGFRGSSEKLRNRWDFSQLGFLKIEGKVLEWCVLDCRGYWPGEMRGVSIYISVLTYVFFQVFHNITHISALSNLFFSSMGDILVVFHNLQMSWPSPMGSRWLLEHGILFSSGISVAKIKYPNKHAISFVHVFAWY